MAKNKKPTTVKHVEVELETKPDVPAYYVNYMSVGHTAFDFVISAGRLPFPVPQEQITRINNGQSMLVDTILQLVVPPRVMKGLLDAVTIQIETYEKVFGKITTEGMKIDDGKDNNAAQPQ